MWEELISIHVPRVEDDEASRVPFLIFCIFQSTSPVWRTTIVSYCTQYVNRISIHVPRVEDDPRLCGRQETLRNFNPRPPCGGRLCLTPTIWVGFCISIHVPRVEDDPLRFPRPTKTRYFNPRPPCGGRRSDLSPRLIRPPNFNPRPPCGGRPHGGGKSNSHIWISIHVPRVEDDSVFVTISDEGTEISIHVPRVEDDEKCNDKQRHGVISIHVPRVEDDCPAIISTR